MKASTVAMLALAASMGEPVYGARPTLNLRTPEETTAAARGDVPNPRPRGDRDPYFVAYRRKRKVRRANKARKARRGW